MKKRSRNLEVGGVGLRPRVLRLTLVVCSKELLLISPSNETWFNELLFIWFYRAEVGG